LFELHRKGPLQRAGSTETRLKKARKVLKGCAWHRQAIEVNRFSASFFADRPSAAMSSIDRKRLVSAAKHEFCAAMRCYLN
jgi:hypothetical protein